MSNIDKFLKWYPKYYDRRETQTEDYELFTELLKGEPIKIFEIACGTGRIMLPLSKEGHEVYGIDMDNNMLSRLFEKAGDAENIHVIKGDAVTADWGREYDAVLLAGNFVMNIENSDDPKSAQIELIKKSYDALKAGGYFIMDNDCYPIPESRFANRSEEIIKDFGTDDEGVSAQMNYVWSSYDTDTQICINFNRLTLTAADGEKYVKEAKHVNHIPTREQMLKWVKDAGFIILNEWGDHCKNPVTNKTERLVVFAQKR